jgi:hypothetical protein
MSLNRILATRASHAVTLKQQGHSKVEEEEQNSERKGVRINLIAWD